MVKLRSLFDENRNITEFLRNELNTKTNSEKIIECAYDLQAGSYIDYFISNSAFCESQYEEYYSIIEPYINENDRLLDVGTGELTTLTGLLNLFNFRNIEVFAFDISLSRVYKGINHYRSNSKKPFKLIPFTAEISNIPLPSNSIDITISNHALEPNSGNLSNLLREIFRISKKCIFFEPSYEINSLEGKKRMDSLGYIKDIDKHIIDAGGKLLDFIPIKKVSNILNPTGCYIVEVCSESEIRTPTFTVPGSDLELVKENNFFICRKTGLVFPILGDIPILRNGNAIIATKL